MIVGAGAAGLFCAGVAAQQGLQVLVLDHSEKVAEKIRISGGGRSNFTNRELDVRAPHKHFLGDNPQFCRSALSRYTPQDFVALIQKHNIPFHEKHKGQLFCDRSAEDLITMLLAECAAGRVEHRQPCAVHAVRHSAEGFELDTGAGPVSARKLVVATGDPVRVWNEHGEVHDLTVRSFGVLRAIDPKTGKEVWRRHTTPDPSEKAYATWPQDDSYKRGGASTWITGSYDPELDLTYWGTGNGGPWNPNARKGDNLYIASVVAIRPKTGEIGRAHV